MIKRLTWFVGGALVGAAGVGQAKKKVRSVANDLAPEPLYQWEILCPDGPEIPASNGLSITAQPLSDRPRRGELICALASWGAEDYTNRDLSAWLRRQSRDGADDG